MMLAPLDGQYQTLLSGPNQPFMYEAIVAAGVAIECNNRAGWQATDKATTQAIIDDEAQWLPFAKTNRVGQVAQRYSTIVAAGRIINGKAYQLDEASFDKLQAYWNNNMWPINWITMDNSTVSLSQAQFQAGAQNVLQYLSAVRLNANVLKNSIRAAGSMAALEAVDIAAGWPSNP